MNRLAAAAVATTLAAALAADLSAQGAPAARSLAARASLVTAPGGRTVADLRAGASVDARGTRAGFTQIVVEGFVDASLLGARQDTFTAHVKAPGGAILRAEAAKDGAPVAVLRTGTGLTMLSRNGRWARVRRAGWVSSRSLAATAPATAKPTAADRPAAPGAPGAAGQPAAGGAPAPASPALTDSAVDPASLLAATGRVTLRSAPDAAALATIERGTTLVPLARERGWIRVRAEGWVREGDVEPADTTGRADLSAADLRANPQRTRGKVVRWVVTVLALQTADGLRKDLLPDEPYLLARGPGEEHAVLYLTVPPALLPTARSLPGLAQVTIVARVRSGRSEPVGVPVLELMSIARQ